eukprot:gene10380-26439_t
MGPGRGSVPHIQRVRTVPDGHVREGDHGDVVVVRVVRADNERLGLNLTDDAPPRATATVRSFEPAPEPSVGLAVLCLPPAAGADGPIPAGLRKKAMPCVIRETYVDDEQGPMVRVEFADKRNLGRMDLTREFYFENARPVKKHD